MSAKAEKKSAGGPSGVSRRWMRVHQPAAYAARLALDRDRRWVRLVAIPLGLERPLDLHADVAGLLGRKLRQPGAELLQVQPGDFLVQLLGQEVHLLLERLAVLPQL